MNTCTRMYMYTDLHTYFNIWNTFFIIYLPSPQIKVV